MAMRFGGKFMLSKEDVIKVAKLSKLEFTEQEIENYRNDLNKIILHMEELNQIDTTGIEPLFNVLDTKDKLRSDIIFDGQSKAEFLANAPESDENFIIVPKIIGE